MDFNESTLFNIMEEISHRKDIKISDIPDIELYMDQVTTFIDNKL
ncbi:MAG: DUF1836 domain-containing protein, partial [Anaerolineaceae bacterium]